MGIGGGEGEASGLWLVRQLRGEFGNGLVRFILCAEAMDTLPVHEDFDRYDIQDCLDVSELGEVHLMAATITALQLHRRLAGPYRIWADAERIAFIRR